MSEVRRTDRMPREYEVDELKALFFEAMSGGWAGGFKSGELNHYPEHDAFTFEPKPLRLCDKWSTGNPILWGDTRIYYERHDDLWCMEYWGFYPKEAETVVKAALSAAYGNQIFHGGRGLDGTEVNDLIYHNEPTPENEDFIYFKGRDSVTRNGVVIGWHEYRGGLIG